MQFSEINFAIIDDEEQISIVKSALAEHTQRCVGTASTLEEAIRLFQLFERNAQCKAVLHGIFLGLQTLPDLYEDAYDFVTKSLPNKPFIVATTKKLSQDSDADAEVSYGYLEANVPAVLQLIVNYADSSSKAESLTIPNRALLIPTSDQAPYWLPPDSIYQPHED